jgi:hypothetical protein
MRHRRALIRPTKHTPKLRPGMIAHPSRRPCPNMFGEWGQAEPEWDDAAGHKIALNPPAAK